jgi:hypothetical protein
MSNPFIESVLMSFDSEAALTWNLISSAEATASFTEAGNTIVVSFSETESGSWRVGFEVSRSSHSSTELVRTSIRIFSGVFQAVQEFLTIRQPNRLVFASKEEGLGRLYDVYLSRQDSTLRALGYRSLQTRATPLAEFAIVKEIPSQWSEYPQ